jgi:hypothetical protein
VVDRKNQALYNLYLKYRAQGIPLDKVAHLWTLGVDILRDEEQQKIRFITKGEKGIESGYEECQMSGNETGLVKSKQSTKYKYIVATVKFLVLSYYLGGSDEEMRELETRECVRDKENERKK